MRAIGRARWATGHVAPEVMVAIAMYAAVATASLLCGPPRLGAEGLPPIRVRPERQRGDGAACSCPHVLVTVSTDCHGLIIARACDSDVGWELGITRWIGVGNRVDTDEDRQAIEELCAEHEVPLDVIIPSTPPDILAADRRGEPLDRATATGVWDEVKKLVDSLGLVAVPFPKSSKAA